MKASRTILAALLVMLVAGAVGATTADAQGVPGISANKCLAGKSKCVKKKAAGLLACRAKCQRSPTNCGAAETACGARVLAKYEGLDAATSCFGRIEAKQNPTAPDTVCTVTGDAAMLEATVDAMVADLVQTLEGNPPPTCGDGVINAAESCDGANLGGATCLGFGYGSGTLGCTLGCGYDFSGCVPYPAPGSCGNAVIETPESCDGANLGGASCASLGYASGSLGCTEFCGYDVSACACASSAFPVTGQTTCWDSDGNVIACAGTGQDGDVQAGAPLAYLDNGDGTISDLNTGLMWEKKSDDGSIHDMHDWYTWDNAFAVFMATLNSGAFAGHTDWRLPNRRELESLYDLENVDPAVAAVFNTACAPGCTVTTCSCTLSNPYWSSSSYAYDPSRAWIVSAFSVYEWTEFKTATRRVRAVRGGS